MQLNIMLSFDNEVECTRQEAVVGLRKTMSVSVTNHWTKVRKLDLPNTEQDFCFRVFLNLCRSMRWAEHVARVVCKRRTCRILVGKAEGRREL
jgi:hypothetical protein